MNDCLFCKIIAGEIPSAKVYEDEICYAFNDISPLAPTHILIIPKKHFKDISEVQGEDMGIVAHIFEVANSLAKERGLDGGYRIVTNCGADAGQTVFHLHFHLLGGAELDPKLC